MKDVVRFKLASVLVFVSLLPYLLLIRSFGFEYSVIANVLGLVGSTLLVWQFVLGNRFVSTKLTPDYVSLTKLHIVLGTYGVLFVFAHPILQVITYGTSILFEQRVLFGRLALFLLTVTWVTSALFRKRMSYRLWLYLHYLNYFVLMIVFLHARSIGTFINTVPYIYYYWHAIFLVFWILLGYRVLKYLNFGKARYALVRKKSLSADITQYTFTPKSKKLTPRPGQFAFVRPSFFGESHPFTIMKFNARSGDLTFSIKAVVRFTNQLENLERGHTVYIDGPYGVFTEEGQNNGLKVVIAGGIGVTPFVELIDRFGHENTFMFYANSFLVDAVNRDDFKRELKENYVDVVSQEKTVQEPVVLGRMSKEILSKYLSKNFLPRAKFFVCGSPGFMASVIGMLDELGVSSNRIYTEEFSL